MISTKKEPEESDVEKTRVVQKKIPVQKVVDPVEGAMTPLSQVSDHVFSSGVLGDGFAIKAMAGISNLWLNKEAHVEAGTPLIRFNLEEVQKQYNPVVLVASLNRKLVPDQQINT